MNKFPKLPGLSFDGTVYENEEMDVLEALLPTGGFPTAHAPAMVELPNGNLLACWFVGTYEGNADIHIICSALGNGETKWSAVTDLSHDPKKSEQNPSLFLGPDDDVWVMYTMQDDRESGKDNMQFMARVRCQKSSDGRRSWGEYETAFPGPGTLCRQPIQILSSGCWIFSDQLHTDSPDGLAGDPTGLRTSDDQGKSWKPVMILKNNDHVHASVIELSPGHLVVFMRHRGAKRIHRGESFNWDESWSEPVPTPLPNNNSGISAVRTRSSHIAVVHNPASAPESQSGKTTWPGLRCSVAVVLSENGGRTFPLIRWVEWGEGFIGDENRTDNRQYECPYLVQGEDGMLHLTYAARTREGIKYLRFREEDVAGKKRETMGLYNPTATRSR